MGYFKDIAIDQLIAEEENFYDKDGKLTPTAQQHWKTHMIGDKDRIYKSILLSVYPHNIHPTLLHLTLLFVDAPLEEFKLKLLDVMRSIQ
jgi:hypothetical protein